MKKSNYIFFGTILYVLGGLFALAIYCTNILGTIPEAYNIVKQFVRFSGLIDITRRTNAAELISSAIHYFTAISGIIVVTGTVATICFRKSENKMYLIGAGIQAALAILFTFVPSFIMGAPGLSVSVVFLLCGISFGLFALLLVFLIKYLFIVLFVQHPLENDRNIMGTMTVALFPLSGLFAFFLFTDAIPGKFGSYGKKIADFVLKNFKVNVGLPTGYAFLSFTSIIMGVLLAYVIIKIVSKILKSKALDIIFDVIGFLTFFVITLVMGLAGVESFRFIGRIYFIIGFVLYAVAIFMLYFLRIVCNIVFGGLIERLANVQPVKKVSEDELTEEEEAYYQSQYGDHDDLEETKPEENNNGDEVYLDLSEDQARDEEYGYGYESVNTDELEANEEDDDIVSYEEDKSPFALSDEEFAALEAEYAEYLEPEEGQTEEITEEATEEATEETTDEIDEDDEFAAFANSLSEKKIEEEEPSNPDEGPCDEVATESESEATEDDDSDEADDEEEAEENEAEETEEESSETEEQQEEAPVEEEPIEKNIQIKEVNVVDEDGNVKKVKKKFNTKMMFAPYEAKEYYNEIKNYLVQYRAKGRISARCETFRYKGLVAKVALAGKSIKVCLALNPADFENTKYHFKDVSAKKNYREVPLMIKVRSPRSLKYFKELVDIMMANRLVKPKRNFEPTNYLTSLIPNGEAIFAQLGLSTYFLQDSMNVRGIPSDLPENLGDYLPAIAADPLADEEVEATVYVDTLCNHFNDGDVVTIDALKSIHVVTKGNVLRVKARGTLDRKLVIYAEYFDDDALKMLLCTNCTVIKIVR